MGTKNIPLPPGRDRKAWNDGLSQVVKSLKATDAGRDAAAIAARIVAFRREFVGILARCLIWGLSEGI